MTKAFLDRLEAGLTRIISELEASRVRCHQLETEADGLRIHGADRDKLEKRVADLEAQLLAAAGASRELPAAIAALDEAKASAARLEAELAIARPRLIDLEQEVSTISADRDAVRSAHFTANSRLAELERTSTETLTSRDGAEAARWAAEARIAELEGWHRDRVSERNAAQTKIAAMDNEIAQLRANRDLQVSAIAQSLSRASENEALKQQVYELQIKELELEESRAELIRYKGDLNSSLTRESQVRERLTTLISKIDEAESLLEMTEVGAHVQS